MTAPRAYVICTTPRSGSTLLCRLLAATGVAGRPDSHFHRPSLAAWLAAHDLRGPFADERAALRAVLVAAVERGSQGGVFALRMQRGSFAHWMGRLDDLNPGLPHDVARIETVFGPTAFVHLARADKLAQAVSRLRAEQSGLWHRAADGAELERLTPPAPPCYDRAAIAAHVETLSAFDRDWEAWFSREGVAPLRLRYEALADNPVREVGRVLAHLGRDPRAAESVPIPTARLSDALNADWIARFRDGGPHATRPSATGPDVTGTAMPGASRSPEGSPRE